MEQGLSLPGATQQVTLYAVFSQLRDMPGHCFPATYLPKVILAAAPHVIAAIPLKPPTRILWPDPAFFDPVGQWFGSVDTEKIQAVVRPFRTQLCLVKPIGRKLPAAICQVLSTENAHFQHLRRCSLRLEFRVKILSFRYRAKVDVTALHPVIDMDFTMDQWLVPKGFSAGFRAWRTESAHQKWPVPGMPLHSNRDKIPTCG